MYQVKEIKDLSFWQEGEEHLLLDLYLPQKEGPFPLLVFFYGGGLEGGRKEDVTLLGREFAAAGVAVAAPSYRLFPTVSYPVFIEDAARAVAWLSHHARQYANVKELFIGGLSAGAYLSMMLCFDSSYLAAQGVSGDVVNGYIFGSGQPTTHFNVLKYRGEDPRAVMIDDTAPIFHIRSDKGAPVLVICDDNDIPNRLEQTQLMVGTLHAFAYKNEVDFEVTHGYGHCGYENVPENGHSRLFELAMPFIGRHSAK